MGHVGRGFVTTLIFAILLILAMPIVLVLVILKNHAEQLEAISEWAETQEQINHEMALWIKQHDQKQQAQHN